MAKTKENAVNPVQQIINQRKEDIAALQKLNLISSMKKPEIDALGLTTLNMLKELKEEFSMSGKTVQEYDSELEVSKARYIDVEKRLEVKLTSGFCSTVLKHQLTKHALYLGEKFLDKSEWYHTSTILDTIEYIDKGVYIEKPLKGNLIGGLYHVHHSQRSQAHAILQNVINHWFTKNGEIRYNKEVLGKPMGWGTKLNLMMTIALFERTRKKELTNEWIVFAKHNGRNYYLCLATHQEGYKETPIYERIKPCLEEFPELRDSFGK